MLSDNLVVPFKGMLEGLLRPSNYPVKLYSFQKALSGDDQHDPMLYFFPANSGSLNYDEQKIEKRELGEWYKGCGVKEEHFMRLEKFWNQRKYYAKLKNGKIAVATDEVVQRSVALKDQYAKMLKVLCCKMEENDRLGVSRQSWRSWFSKSHQQSKARTVERKKRKRQSTGACRTVRGKGGLAGEGVFGDADELTDMDVVN